jgi:hypothetical protein
MARGARRGRANRVVGERQQINGRGAGGGGLDLLAILIVIANDGIGALWAGAG